MRIGIIFKGIIFLSITGIAFAYGMGVGKYKWFPYNALMQVKTFAFNGSTVEFDKFGRLVSDSSKIEVDCPEQNKSVGVLLVVGQSNSANHADHKYKESELHDVYNYFNGKCYQASSPLLGATGADGEWITKAAKNLIDQGVYEKVVIVSTGIGGTPVVRWAEGNDLNKMLKNVLFEISKSYRITEVIWHQGESDRRYTHTSTYEEMFKSVLSTIRRQKVDAPVFLSIASVCYDFWVYPNRVSQAQNNLVLLSSVERGVNTDELIGQDKRYDNCHFNKEGQEIAAKEMARKIKAYREY